MSSINLPEGLPDVSSLKLPEGLPDIKLPDVKLPEGLPAMPTPGDAAGGAAAPATGGGYDAIPSADPGF